MCWGFRCFFVQFLLSHSKRGALERLVLKFDLKPTQSGTVRYFFFHSVLESYFQSSMFLLTMSVWWELLSTSLPLSLFSFTHLSYASLSCWCVFPYYVHCTLCSSCSPRVLIIGSLWHSVAKAHNTCSTFSLFSHGGPNSHHNSSSCTCVFNLKGQFTPIQKYIFFLCGAIY